MKNENDPEVSDSCRIMSSCASTLQDMSAVKAENESISLGFLEEHMETPDGKDPLFQHSFDISNQLEI